MLNALLNRVKHYTETHDKLIPLFLDTETTGLDFNAKIVEICVADLHGNIIINTLINPEIKIPLCASDIHCIKDKDVKKAPTFPEIIPILNELIKGRNVYIYNADYDIRLIRQSADDSYQFPEDTTFIDVLYPFAKLYGEWSDYFNDYKFQRLSTACRYFNIDTTEFGELHRAKADVLATIEVFKAMQALHEEKELAKYY
ncbi:hypothetical protein A1D22_09110 [Pasteurellaceae bacterium LFhippo2]|nr:hypothetical protein [Pasteurellaceae bacterium LFhippo2]